ncbi:hypothetical protein [Litchfieldella xinjiangensis]|uniref:hypothetical protein n=1 Tax=Litchfieldella xinjiangensis TaxID=1166948 RepID=UPI0005BD98D0|nr:hypothetical protein [Halomonas xinjiangensis]
MKRARKLTRAQHNTMTARSQRQVNLVFFYRRGSWDSEIDRHGFLAPVDSAKHMAILRMANLAPQHWEVLCIVYCRAQDGSEYREFASGRTNQRIAAWRHRRDDSGKLMLDEEGGPLMEDQLLSIIRETLEAAESGCNPNHIIDRAVIMRPWSANWPSMLPVLRRLRTELDLTNDDLEQWEAA